MSNSATKVEANHNARVQVGNTIIHNHSDPRQLRSEFLRLLSGRYKDRKDWNPTRAEGTCEWFTDHHLFQEWQNETSALLLVSADPGCGKSVLTRYLVDDVLCSNDTRTTCYFFFKDDFEDQRVLECAICCILNQLFVQQPSLLLDKFLQSFQEKGDQLFTSFKGLWGILVEAASHATGQVVCILDALDECVDSTPLAAALTQLYTEGTGASSLKFLVTSRPYLYIQRGFQRLEESQPTIHLRGAEQEEVDKIAREIDIVIRHRTKELSQKLQFTAAEEKVLHKEITTVKHRTYLWVDLVLASIEDIIILTQCDLQEALCGMPRSVEEAYNKILCRSRDPGKARKILHIIVAAERPLSLPEMAVALTFRYERHKRYKEIEQDFRSPDRLKLEIRETCGLFVVVQGSQITLLHQTAREFLVQLPAGLSEAHSLPLEWKYSLNPADSHRVLSEICIRYLLLPDLGPRADREASQYEIADDTDEMPTLVRYMSNEGCFSFLNYAASFWTDHYRLARKTSGMELERQALRLCDTKVGAVFKWLDNDELCTPLLIASYFGLHNLVRIILQRDRKCHSEAHGPSQRTALSWASENGHETVVEELLSCVPNLEVLLRDWSQMPTVVNMGDLHGRTPISYAAASGHSAVVRLLLGKGAKASIQDINNVTPLWWAVLHGRDEVMALLLSKDGLQEPEANKYLEMRDKQARTPLIRAAEDGNETAVKLLLERGAQIEARCPNFKATLIRNTSVKLLCDGKDYLTDEGDGHQHSFTVEGAYQCGATALIAASSEGREEVVRLLLERGAQINASDEHSMTALMLASLWGHEAVVRLLLERGAQVDVSADGGITAFMLASEEGHKAVARLLLDGGVQIEASTALTNAIRASRITRKSHIARPRDPEWGPRDSCGAIRPSGLPR